jgi:hypothetical protein
MEKENSKIRGEPKRSLLGLFVGILTLAIPFLGHWWELRIGKAFIFKLDPFNPEINVLGNEVFIPIVYWTGLSIKLLVLFSGAVLVLGSITNRWWSVHLVRFGSTKLCWIVAATLIPLLVLSFEIPGIELPFKIPINGVSTEVIRMENVKVTLQVYAGITRTFWIAFFASLLGIYVRVRYRVREPKQNLQ